MAEQLADRFKIPGVYTDVAEMLAAVKPDVVHITTPAQSHLALGRFCLESGSHVYMEKPFALNTSDAESLIGCAESKGLKLTVGHNLQFSSESLRMRELVRNGFLGGPPVHMESIQCFSHADPVYGAAVLGDRGHWVRKLPGSLLHNLISHGVAKIAEFLPSEDFDVVAVPFTSPGLKDMGEDDIVDELRAIIRCANGTTAYFTFTTRFGVAMNELRLYGPSNSLLVDNINRMIVPIRRTGYKSYMRYFLAPHSIARAYRLNSWQNIMSFLRCDFHQDNSMKNLIQSFYTSILHQKPVPIPYSEVVATSRIMDGIFRRIQRPEGL
jgi:predicted dehydrogenase